MLIFFLWLPYPLRRVLLRGFVGNELLVTLLLLFALVATGLYAHLPAFWPIPTIFLGSMAAASAIGFINMIGNLGGSVGPVIIGDAAKSNDFALGLWRIAIVPFIGATAILLAAFLRRGRANGQMKSWQ